MTYTEMEDILLAVTAVVPDDLLPDLRIEQEGNRRTAWSGGRGIYLNSGKRNGQPDPRAYVRQAITDLLHAEAVRRLEVSEAEVLGATVIRADRRLTDA